MQTQLSEEEEPEEAEDTSVLTATPTEIVEGTVGERRGLEAITGAVVGLFTEGNAGIGFSVIAAIIVLGIVIYFFVNKKKE